mmetsp:Transcript_29172/g.28228  ORF Transcript_29172/g.28228 Transcript_29172/m.28228 type:complete len:133 (+) Transcript_29172:1337-1735(+)
MFHFKQQMMLNKLLCKGTQSHQTSVHENLGSKLKGLSSGDSKGAVASVISSKRPSNEAERYISPRSNLQNAPNAQSEMKNLLTRFQKFSGQPNPPPHSNIQLIQSSGDTLSGSSYGVTRGSTTMGSTQTTQA